MIDSTPNVHAPAYSYTKEPSGTSCLDRVWSAVAAFFTKIASYFSAAWQSIKYVIDPTLIPIDFVNKAIQTHQNHLREKGGLEEFNKEWETVSNSVDIAEAVVRKYIFSDSEATAVEIPFFKRVVRRERGEYVAAVIDPQTKEQIYHGGYEMRPIYEDCTIRLRALRGTFNRLDPREKEIVMDKIDFEGINKMDVSEEATGVLKGIAEVANLLHHNRPFVNTVQAVHAQMFPD